MTKTRTVDHWFTVGGIPLTDYVNVYTAEDGTEFTSPCPALLVQELRQTVWIHSDDPDMRSTQDHEPPYETRVVAGDMDPSGTEPALEVSNYVRTVPRSDFEKRGRNEPG